MQSIGKLEGYTTLITAIIYNFESFEEANKALSNSYRSGKRITKKFNIEEAIKLKLEGQQNKTIAKTYGLPANTVTTYISRYKHGKTHERTTVNVEILPEKQMVDEYINKHMTMGEMAKLHDVKPYIISKSLKHWDIKSRKRGIEKKY